MHLRSLSRLAASALVLAALAAPPLASAEGAGQPFKARIATHEALSVDPSRCPFDMADPLAVRFAGQTTGRGVASHLGAVALTGADCVTPGFAFGPQGPQIVGFAFGSAASPGTFTLVAANGDRVTGNYWGRLAPASASEPIFSIQDGRYVITGGSGRFAGATGQGEVLGRLLLDQNPENRTSTGVVELVGTLAY